MTLNKINLHKLFIHISRNRILTCTMHVKYNGRYSNKTKKNDEYQPPIFHPGVLITSINLQCFIRGSCSLLILIYFCFLFFHPFRVFTSEINRCNYCTLSDIFITIFAYYIKNQYKTRTNESYFSKY